MRRVELAVGAPGADVAGARDAGRVTVFADPSGATALYEREGSQPGERFGAAVAVDPSGGRLLVGAPGFDGLVPSKHADGRVGIFAGESGAGAALFTLELLVSRAG